MFRGLRRKIKRKQIKLKLKTKQIAYLFGFSFDKFVSSEEIKGFLSRFRDKYTSIELVRIGTKGDGGYLLPDNLNSVKYCFSPGVDYAASFEAELSKSYGIKSFMADASVASPPVSDENFTFVPKFLGSRTHGKFITLSDWIEQSIGTDTCEKILQMDIEGGEYDVLTYETADLFAKFSTLIIEFHDVHHIFERNFFLMFSGIFEKLFQNFSICHVHPNNYGGITRVNNIDVPNVLEITFIRNDLINQFSTTHEVKLPHHLDCINGRDYDEINMPKIWWPAGD